MAKQPQVITCQGGSNAARLAADVARELGSLGVAEPVEAGVVADAGPGGERETIALDGCSSACGSRLAAARGLRLVAALNLAELGVGDAAAQRADRRVLAARVATQLRHEATLAHPARPHRHGHAKVSSGGQAHSVEDYLLALDALTSPVVECGALITDVPTFASHLSDALGVSRATAGEMLVKIESSGLIRRGSRKELLLTEAGRALADTGVRRQRLLEVFANEFLGYDLAETSDCARRLRGAFDDDALARLDAMLGFPVHCPHGWPVDAVRAREENSLLRTLASLAVGDRAQVARLAEDDNVSLRQLVEHGVVPGVDLVVAAVTPSGEHYLTTGRRRFALGETASRAVLVRPLAALSPSESELPLSSPSAHTVPE